MLNIDLLLGLVNCCSVIQEREAALKSEVELLRYELQQQRIKMQENTEIIVSLQVKNNLLIWQQYRRSISWNIKAMRLPFSMWR